MSQVSHHPNTKVKPVSRCLYYLLLGMLVLVVPLIGIAQESLPVQSTSDSRLEKHYQQILFAYYQDDLDGALLQYSLLEHKYPDGLQQLPQSLYLHPNEAELLKGSISLAYGLEDQAAEIFSRLLAQYNAPEKRTGAWFVLGLTFYQQGQWLKASQAFVHIDFKAAQDYLDLDSQDQLIYLRAQLFNQHGLGEQQEDWQQQLSVDSLYHYYLSYNKALTYLQLGQTEQAIAQLKQLGSAPEAGLQQFLSDWLIPLEDENNEEQFEAQQQEILAIQDRINLTLAYTLLQQGQSNEAYAVFARIRRQGLDGDAALLGYGWAAAKGEELQIALGIWQSLMALPEHSEYSLEAYLAAAYAYEKGFAPRQSVATLQQGLQRFKRVLTELNQASESVKQGDFIQALAQGFSADNPSVELPALADVNADATNTTSLLSRLVQNAGMTKTTRNQLAALQQTQTMAKQLNDWQQRLAHYSLMLDERQSQRVIRAQTMLQARIFDQLSALQSRRDDLAAQLITAQQQQDGSSLMPVVFQQSQTRLNTALGRLNSINQQKNTLQQAPVKTDYDERLRRIQGILNWQANEAFAENNWQVQKALTQLDAEISHTAAQQSRLLAMLAKRPDFAQQRQRVAQLAERINTQLHSNELIQQQLVAHISQYLGADIAQFKVNVENYVIQAQLALVRLNDQALQQNQNDAAIRPADIGRPPALEPPARQQP
ncbi:hypothetical protein [Paraglaciecola sp.]|uniref:hypothetical protein n=1 Tax=Paraglaciecola sp. TaxID=1920173 RepID=UPI0030F45AFC